ncbi:AraC family transcriptional regulator [Paraburkholderia bryophila]|uniref:AraC family transcriptional regulator n=1 Tax=Paraburkholderia bryophila TaxID=420952 RepID=UPI00234B8417|nr:AraC family transcriptional regulator [Paraburkholderia bryophila]WCM20122.1 AraC family transcriptional regulator [Paraburkholderia bryophila]
MNQTAATRPTHRLASEPASHGTVDMEPHIAQRAGVGAGAIIEQQQELEFKRLLIDKPLLVVVESGAKIVRWSGGEYLIRAGDAVAIAGGQSLDVINRLPENGSYRARWLTCDEHLIAAHAERHPEQPVIRHALAVVEPRTEFGEAFNRTIQAIGNASIPTSIAQHRVAEMLLWMGIGGGRFSETSIDTLTVRIRRLIGSDLAHEWSAPAVASALAMSESTMRRKLAEENATLTEILADARMSFALNLLQSTRHSVTQIAGDVGYKTLSHFAARFHSRFGFPPTAIRRLANGHEEVRPPHA